MQHNLLCRCQSGISHIIIKSRDGKFDVGSGNQFGSLSALVSFYRENPQLRDAKTHVNIKLEEVSQSVSHFSMAVLVPYRHLYIHTYILYMHTYSLFHEQNGMFAVNCTHG